MIDKLKILPMLILLFFHYRADAQLVSGAYFDFYFELKDSTKYDIEEIKCLKINSDKILEGCCINSGAPYNGNSLYSISVKNQENQDDIQIYFYIDKNTYSTIIPLRGIFEVIFPENMSKGTYCFNLYDGNFSESNLAVKKEYESSVDSLRQLEKNTNDNKSRLEIYQKIKNAVYDLKSEFYLFYPVPLGYANNTVVEITPIGMSSNIVSESILTPIEIEEYIKNPNKEKPEAVKKILSVFDGEKQN